MRIAIALVTGAGRIVALKGLVRLSADALVKDTGQPDVVVSSARQTPVEELPDGTLLFLLGSRYCETDRLSDTAWQPFGKSPAGWGRVQAICDYVHRHIMFVYKHACPTKSAWEAFHEGPAFVAISRTSPSPSVDASTLQYERQGLSQQTLIQQA